MYFVGVKSGLQSKQAVLLTHQFQTATIQRENKTGAQSGNGGGTGRGTEGRRWILECRGFEDSPGVLPVDGAGAKTVNRWRRMSSYDPAGRIKYNHFYLHFRDKETEVQMQKFTSNSHVCSALFLISSFPALQEAEGETMHLLSGTQKPTEQDSHVNRKEAKVET